MLCVLGIIQFTERIGFFYFVYSLLNEIMYDIVIYLFIFTFPNQWSKCGEAKMQMRVVTKEISIRMKKRSLKMVLKQ